MIIQRTYFLDALSPVLIFYMDNSGFVQHTDVCGKSSICYIQGFGYILKIHIVSLG